MEISEDAVKKDIIETLKSKPIRRFTDLREEVVDKYNVQKESDKKEIRNIVYRVLEKNAVEYVNSKNTNRNPLIYKISYEDLEKAPEIEGIIKSTGQEIPKKSTYYFLPNILNDFPTTEYYAEEILKWFKEINAYYNGLSNDEQKNYSEDEKMQLVYEKKSPEIKLFENYVSNLWSRNYGLYLSIEKVIEILENVILTLPQTQLEYKKSIKYSNLEKIKVKELLYQIDQGKTMNKLLFIIFEAVKVKNFTKETIYIKHYFYLLMDYIKYKIVDSFLNQFNYEDLNKNESYGFTKEMLKYALKSYIVLINAEINYENLNEDAQRFYNFILDLIENKKLAKFEKGFLQELIFPEENKVILSYILNYKSEKINKREELQQKYEENIKNQNYDTAEFLRYLLESYTRTKNEKRIYV